MRMEGTAMRRLNRTMLTICLLIVSLFTCPCMRMGQAIPQYSASASLSVEPPVEIVLHDSPRSKDLRVMAVYPRGKGPYPVIVFSHGWGGKPDAYIHLVTYWAAHGYVILAPTHADAGDIARLGTMKDETEDPAAWKNRVRDVTFTADSLDTVSKLIPDLAGKMDKTWIGAGGHSYGAYVSQLIDGATVDIPDGPRGVSFADKRFRSALLLSPQGIGRMGLTESSWDGIHRPMMVMTGSKDRPFGAGVSDHSRTDPYLHSPAGNKYLAYIDGATHLTFCDMAINQETRHPGLRFLRSRTGMTQTDMYDYVMNRSLAFWDATLKDSAPARKFLRDEALAAMSGGPIHFSAK